jgi:hypothetical protein
MSVYSRRSAERVVITRHGLMAVAAAAAGLLLPVTAFAQGSSKMELQSSDPLTQNIQTFTWDGRRGLDAAMSRPNHFVQGTRLLSNRTYTTGRPLDLFGSRMDRTGSGSRFGSILGPTGTSGRRRGSAASGKMTTGLRSGQTVLSPGLLDPVSLGLGRNALGPGISDGSSSSSSSTGRKTTHRAGRRP